jgi:DMSO/TMAO reductase YedYZ molybdopterin-dependent catalytic subunit
MTDADPGRSARAEVDVWLARLAGALAAVVALAVGELVSAFGDSEQSLIASVGNSFIKQFAASLKDIAVRLFGTSDKAALVIGIVIISALIGSALGVASRARPLAGRIGFGAFGTFGLYAGLVDPLTNKVLVVLAAVGATAAGIATLEWLLRVAATGSAMPMTTTRTRHAGGVTEWPRDASAVTEHPTDPKATRRAFFGWAGAAGAFAVTLSLAGRSLAGRSKAEEARDLLKLPPVGGNTTGTTSVLDAGSPMGVRGLSSYYTPNKDFYKIDTAVVVPQVDPAQWKLSITGMVDHPFEITLDEILALPQVEESVTLQCVSNEVNGDLVGNARWQGVPLKTLLDRAGLQAGATQIATTSIDEWTAGFPTSIATDGRTALLAVGMNGEPLPIPHGFPARLVVAGLYGYVSATKWITEIRLTRWEDFDGYWIDKGWSKEGPIKIASRIDVPSVNASVSAGPTKIAGVAWAPNTGIRKVEVQVDDGDWVEARLGEVVSKNTWVQWVLDWEASSGQHTIRCRATDATGETQTSDFAPPAPNGSTGYPSVRVKVA